MKRVSFTEIDAFLENPGIAEPLFWGAFCGGWSASICAMAVSVTPFLPDNPFSLMFIAVAAALWAGAGYISTSAGGTITRLRRSLALLTVVQLFAAMLVPAFAELVSGRGVGLRLAYTGAAAFPVGYLAGLVLRTASGRRQNKSRNILYATVGILAGFLATLLTEEHFGLMQALLVGPALFLTAAAFAEDI